MLQSTMNKGLNDALASEQELFRELGNINYLLVFYFFANVIVFAEF